ncbi:hypothetical protein ASF65_11710 [Aureimonas sp. Leaf324]|nr:hypothetical protein ASF65_11710 [Aureimonas sp. Leaf324]
MSAARDGPSRGSALPRPGGEDLVEEKIHQERRGQLGGRRSQVVADLADRVHQRPEARTFQMDRRLELEGGRPVPFELVVARAQIRRADGTVEDVGARQEAVGDDLGGREDRRGADHRLELAAGGATHHTAPQRDADGVEVETLGRHALEAGGRLHRPDRQTWRADPVDVDLRRLAAGGPELHRHASLIVQMLERFETVDMMVEPLFGIGRCDLPRGGIIPSVVARLRPVLHVPRCPFRPSSRRVQSWRVCGEALRLHTTLGLMAALRLPVKVAGI